MLLNRLERGSAGTKVSAEWNDPAVCAPPGVPGKGVFSQCIEGTSAPAEAPLPPGRPPDTIRTVCGFAPPSGPAAHGRRIDHHASRHAGPPELGHAVLEPRRRDDAARRARPAPPRPGPG